MEVIVCRIFLKEIVDIVCLKGFCFVYLYGLFKIYKKNFLVCFILFLIVMYNYFLVKWLDDKLKILFINNYIIFDIFMFVE